MFRKTSCFCGSDSADGDSIIVVKVCELRKRHTSRFACWGDFWEPLRLLSRHSLMLGQTSASGLGRHNRFMLRKGLHS